MILAIPCTACATVEAARVANDAARACLAARRAWERADDAILTAWDADPEFDGVTGPVGEATARAHAASDTLWAAFRATEVACAMVRGTIRAARMNGDHAAVYEAHAAGRRAAYAARTAERVMTA